MQVSVTKEKPARMTGEEGVRQVDRYKPHQPFHGQGKDWGTLFQTSRGAIDILGDAF